MLIFKFSYFSLIIIFLAGELQFKLLDLNLSVISYFLLFLDLVLKIINQTFLLFQYFIVFGSNFLNSYYFIIKTIKITLYMLLFLKSLSQQHNLLFLDLEFTLNPRYQIILSFNDVFKLLFGLFHLLNMLSHLVISDFIIFLLIVIWFTKCII